MLNARGIPTAVCPNCSSNMLKIYAWFDEETYELAGYMIDSQCADCGTLLTAPTPVDERIEDEY